jgi:N-acetylglucosamine-6-sulfatase
MVHPIGRAVAPIAAICRGGPVSEGRHPLGPVNRTLGWRSGRRRIAKRRRARAWIVGLVILAGTLAVGAPGGTAAVARPDIVVILTDDQRFDTLWAMPILQEQLVARGVTFSNAFVSNPLCCPSRASILTGQYSHTNGVYTNDPPEGGFPVFDDSSTLPVWLHDAGYRTALLGKYLNAYADSDSPYVPPGWDRWFTFTGNGQGTYYGFRVSNDGVLTWYDKTQYSTDVLAGQADSFIRSTTPGQSLFVYLSVKAPHGPPAPAVRHIGAFDDLPPYRPPNYNEQDVTDKPLYIQEENAWSLQQQAAEDAYKKKEYETLLAVDEAVGTVVTALTDTGRLSNTLIVFMSDNGRLGGEHRFNGKTVPYEESIRVPLVIRFDRLAGTPRIESRMVLNIDLAPTLAAVAGVPAPDVDGTSLIPILRPGSANWRKDFLLEHRYIPPEPNIPTYCGVRSRRYAYIAYDTGEEELYDILIDPYQLENRATDPGFQGTLNSMRARLSELCVPPPAGFVAPTPTAAA